MRLACRGGHGSGATIVAVRIRPPILLALFLALGFLANWLRPLGFLSPRMSAVAGPVLTFGALGLFAWAVRTMRSVGESPPPTVPTKTIVVGGPYRYSRNPIYVAMVSLQAGVGLWANGLWFLALAAIFALIIARRVVAGEEEYLERTLGSEYASYRARVRRWI